MSFFQIKSIIHVINDNSYLPELNSRTHTFLKSKRQQYRDELLLIQSFLVQIFTYSLLLRWEYDTH